MPRTDRIFYDVEFQRCVVDNGGKLTLHVKDWKAFLDSAVECEALSLDGMREYLEKNGGVK